MVEYLEDSTVVAKGNYYDGLKDGKWYYNVGDHIEEIMDCNVTLIHTGEAISKHLLTLGSQKGHLNQGDLQIHIHATGEIKVHIVDSIIDRYENWLEKNITADHTQHPDHRIGRLRQLTRGGDGYTYPADQDAFSPFANTHPHSRCC